MYLVLFHAKVICPQLIKFLVDGEHLNIGLSSDTVIRGRLYVKQLGLLYHCNMNLLEK